jgi:hypothetical protein
MAGVDPYSPCPCGSGEKFKWCCHKVEAFADRAQRLAESGHFDSAIEAIEEGLRKEPDNPWLVMRKTLYLTRTHRFGDAEKGLRSLLKKNKRHIGAQFLLTRLLLESEGASAGVHQLQNALGSVSPSDRPSVARLVKVVASFLVEAQEYPSALAHLRLAASFLSDEADRSIATALHSIEQNHGVSPWQKNPGTLAPPPPELVGAARDRFVEAIQWSREGLWTAAAAAFETLSSDPIAGPLADRNQGFCRLWLLDDVAAVAAIRRYVARLGPTTEAVDLEVLCQEIAPVGSGGMVEQVHLIWPLRNRAKLLEILGREPSVVADDATPLDPSDENSPTVDAFVLLDRPPLSESPTGLKIDIIPRIVGRILVGTEIAVLETYDDGRLDRLVERFTALAASTIPPAHPKTKTVANVARLDLALTPDWLIPESVEPSELQRLAQEQADFLLLNVWPNTPNPALRHRTPLQAAAARDAEVPLRAAVAPFDQTRNAADPASSLAKLRAKLQLPPEPVIDPKTVDLATLHLARFVYVPIDELSDETLVQYHQRAAAMALDRPLEASIRALVARPDALKRLGDSAHMVYIEAAMLAATRAQPQVALDWLRRGREADSPAARLRNGPLWEILEVRIKAQSEPPETWVPDLAVVLDRYQQDDPAMQVIMVHLLDMGLVGVVQNPDRSGQVYLDSRALQQLLAEYGPRVTTATGRLGISATKPEIWTPGSTSGSTGGLFVPGASSAPPPSSSGGPSKLIVPGR